MISGFADGRVLRTKSGIVKLYFSELPKEVQERIQYDHAKTRVASSLYQKTPMNVARPSALPAAIEKVQRLGLLRLDCSDSDAKAWISPIAWKRYDASEKEDFTKNLEPILIRTLDRFGFSMSIRVARFRATILLGDSRSTRRR